MEQFPACGGVLAKASGVVILSFRNEFSSITAYYSKNNSNRVKKRVILLFFEYYS
ncbi:MAG: hypothetical protein FWG85_08125 [Bacteroidetes bacterium]|nr:hypothetical protein [Bacteroidota bacterium]